MPVTSTPFRPTYSDARSIALCAVLAACTSNATKPKVEDQPNNVQTAGSSSSGSGGRAAAGTESAGSTSDVPNGGSGGSGGRGGRGSVGESGSGGSGRAGRSGSGGSGGAGGRAIAGSSAAGSGGAGAGGSAGDDEENGAGGAGGAAGAAGTDGGAGAGGSSGAGSGGAGGNDNPTEACGGSLLEVPDDVSVRGPWDVGVKTVMVPRSSGSSEKLNVEVLYPAQPGSTADKSEATYDLRQWLPADERSKVPDANSPAVSPLGGHLYRDVPIDAEHGPYPLIVFIHGTASFRIASITLNTHWASRGFIVVAADFPGFTLEDELNEACSKGKRTQNIMSDVQAQIAAVKDSGGDLAFLMGRTDLARIGVSGHSQGACNAAVLSTLPNVRIVLPLSGSTATAMSSSLKSLIYVSGIDDTVIGYDRGLVGNIVCPPPSSSDKQAYNDSPSSVTKRLVGITGGGHLLPTDLCQKNAQGRNAIAEAQQDGVCGINNAAFIGLPALFDCGTIDWKEGVASVIYPTTAALEETLQCKDRTQAFAELKSNVKIVGEFQESKPAGAK